MIVPQQPAYGQDGFAMCEGNAGVGVPEIVRPDIPKAGFRPHVLPEIGDSERWSRFRQCEGKTHALFLGSRSRTSRAADDSQTVRGPLLLSRRKSLPSR